MPLMINVVLIDLTMFLAEILLLTTLIILLENAWQGIWTSSVQMWT